MKTSFLNKYSLTDAFDVFYLFLDKGDTYAVVDKNNNTLSGTYISEMLYDCLPDNVSMTLTDKNGVQNELSLDYVFSDTYYDGWTVQMKVVHRVCENGVEQGHVCYTYQVGCGDRYFDDSDLFFADLEKVETFKITESN